MKTLKDKRTGELISCSKLPLYSKFDINGCHYGYIILSFDMKVYYFTCQDDLNFEEVTNLFEIL